MGTAFSQDLRDRVIKAIESGKFCRSEVAEDLQVSIEYVDSVMRRYRQTGSREAKPGKGGRRRVLREHRDWIRQTVEQTPDITLEALCVGLSGLSGLSGLKHDQDKKVHASPSMMCRELADMALPLKKSRFTTANGTRSE